MNVLRTNLRHRFGRLMKAAVLAISISGLGIANAQQPSFRLLGATPTAGIARPTDRTSTAPASTPAASPKPAAASRTMTAQEIAERLKYSTCYIRIPGVSLGTGWVIDAEKRLVMTNHHVIVGAKEIHVYFPQKRNGQWVNEEAYYRNSVKPAKGTIIASSKVHDLAVIQLDSLPSGVRALPLAQTSAPQGARLHSLGGRSLGSMSMWIYTYGHVRQVGRGTTAMGYATRIVEAQMETNKGNSGGPIVNDAGELVAVVEGHRSTQRNGSQVYRVRNISITIDVMQVRAYLTEVLPLVDPQTADQFLSRGTAHYTVGRYNTAIRDFSAAIRIQPRLAAAYAKRGWAFYHKGDHATAIEDFNQAIEISPTLSDAFVGRGQCHRGLKKYTEAIRDFSNAIRFQPESGKSYNLRGIVFLATKQKESAHRDFVQATKLNSKEPVFFYNLGAAARALGRYQEAVAAYTQAIKLRSTDHDYFNGLGLAQYSLKSYEKAAKAFLMANTVYKKRYNKYSWVYFENAGLALHRMNKLKAAYAAMTKAIELNGTYGKLRYLRGLIAKDLGRQDLASQDFRKAAELDPKKYGKLASNGSKGQKQATTNGTRRTTRRGSEYVASRALGTWGFRGTLKGHPVRIAMVLRSDGRYSLGFVFTNPDGRQTKQIESGAFRIRGDQIILVSDNGARESRRFGFRDGQMWLDLTADGQSRIRFTRMVS